MIPIRKFEKIEVQTDMTMDSTSEVLSYLSFANSLNE